MNLRTGKWEPLGVRRIFTAVTKFYAFTRPANANPGTLQLNSPTPNVIDARGASQAHLPSLTRAKAL